MVSEKPFNLFCRSFDVTSSFFFSGLTRFHTLVYFLFQIWNQPFSQRPPLVSFFKNWYWKATIWILRLSLLLGYSSGLFIEQSWKYAFLHIKCTMNLYRYFQFRLNSAELFTFISLISVTFSKLKITVMPTEFLLGFISHYMQQ